MNKIKPANYIIFFISALVLGFLFLSTGILSKMFDLPAYTDIILKILLIVLLCVYAVKHDDFNSFFNIHFSPVYLILIVIPVTFSIILKACPLDFYPYPSFIILTIVGTLTTAIWEELYFRYFGCSLFEENGKFKWYNIIFLAAVFSIGHVFNIFFDGIYSGVTQIFFTFGLGIFLLALYIHTKAIIVPIIAHFCINFVSDFFYMNATDQSPLIFADIADPVYVIYILVLIAMGLYILKKNNHIT